jgi:hypothetical protein
MNDWFKFALMLGGVGITMYVTQSEQSFRLAALEKEFDQHLTLHNRDLNEIKKDVNSIQVSMARVVGKECPIPLPGKLWEQSFRVQ